MLAGHGVEIECCFLCHANYGYSASKFCTGELVVCMVITVLHVHAKNSLHAIFTYHMNTSKE